MSEGNATPRTLKYRSRPAECEAMQWDDTRLQFKLQDLAAEVVAWVNANGGEARYESHGYGESGSADLPVPPRIAVRTINGWAYAKPGHYVVMGEVWWDPNDRPHPPTKRFRDFYPCDPDTFERRWQNRCCDMHNRSCEPPSELCCENCTEACHGMHECGQGWTTGHHGHPEECIAPDLSHQLGTVDG